MICSQAEFTNVTRPSASVSTTASRTDSTTVRYWASLSRTAISERLRSVASMTTPTIWTGRRSAPAPSNTASPRTATQRTSSVPGRTTRWSRSRRPGPAGSVAARMASATRGRSSGWVSALNWANVNGSSES